MKNYSRQREAILNVLRSTDTHPTAKWVYEKTREVIPNISLGTVYRNLSALSKSGDILSVPVGDGNEHFDGNMIPHLHQHCYRCGQIYDIMLDIDPFKTAALNNGFSPMCSLYLVSGVCAECNSKEKINFTEEI